MNKTEKVINDLNVAKHMLCNSQMLTSEMNIKIGQAITNAVMLLKEHEPVKPEYKLLPGSETIHEWECGNCGYSLFMILNHENRYSAKSVVHYCPGCGRPVNWDE